MAAVNQDGAVHQDARAHRDAADPDGPEVPAEDLAQLRHHGDRELRPGDVDHAVNVLAGGPPDWLAEALARVDLGRYPDPGPAQIALAGLHGRDPAEVVITNGAAEALWLLGPALAPDRAVLVQPGFTETEVALRAHGIPVERCEDAGKPGTTAASELWVWTNPTSPDGRLRDPAAILATARPGRRLVVDEAFMSMVPGEPGSLAAERRADLIVVRSLTKLLSVPGLRVGYALVAPPLAARIRAVQPPWSANALALAALEAAAARPAALAERARRAAAERDDLIARLDRLARSAGAALGVHPSVTNFVLVEVPDGPRVLAGLRERRIAVRPCASFPGFGAGHLRLTARDPAANARLVAALAELV